MCMVEYQSKFECSQRKPAITADTIKWHISRENHRDPFEALYVIVDEKKNGKHGNSFIIGPKLSV